MWDIVGVECWAGQHVLVAIDAADLLLGELGHHRGLAALGRPDQRAPDVQLLGHEQQSQPLLDGLDQIVQRPAAFVFACSEHPPQRVSIIIIINHNHNNK
jgi:hypothetical protein